MFGHFILPSLGGRYELLDAWTSGTAGYGTGEVYVANGRVYIGNCIYPSVATS